MDPHSPQVERRSVQRLPLLVLVAILAADRGTCEQLGNAGHAIMMVPLVKLFDGIEEGIEPLQYHLPSLYDILVPGGSPNGVSPMVDKNMMCGVHMM